MSKKIFAAVVLFVSFLYAGSAAFAQTVVIPNPDVVPKGQILRSATISVNGEGRRVDTFGRLTGEIGEYAFGQSAAFGGPYEGQVDLWSPNGRAATEAYASSIAQAIAQNHLPAEFGTKGYFYNEKVAVFQMITNGTVRFFQKTNVGIDPVTNTYVTKGSVYSDMTSGGGFFPWMMGDHPVPHVITWYAVFGGGNVATELAQFKFVSNDSLEVIKINPMIQAWQSRRQNQPTYMGQELKEGDIVKVWREVLVNGKEALSAAPIFWWFNNEADKAATKIVFPEVEKGDSHLAGDENLTLVLLAPTVYRFTSVDSYNPNQGGSQQLANELGMPGVLGWLPFNLRRVR